MRSRGFSPRPKCQCLAPRHCCTSGRSDVRRKRKREGFPGCRISGRRVWAASCRCAPGRRVSGKVRSCCTASRWNALPLVFRPRPLGSPLLHPCGGLGQRVWLSTTYRNASGGGGRLVYVVPSDRAAVAGFRRRACEPGARGNHRRVREQPCGCSLPSEPDWRVSPHPAQATGKPPVKGAGNYDDVLP